MLKAIATITAVYAAYRFGVYQSQINAMDYLVVNVRDYGTGVQINEYVQITAAGIEFTQDAATATPMLLVEANKLKALLRKHIPNINLQLQTSNQIQIAI